MKLDTQALYSLVIQEMAMHTAAVTPWDEIVDAFCGAGGSAIGFARAGKRVMAIELNGERLEMARYNAALFGVADRITFMHGDSLQLLPTLKADTVFLAPPWGGPDYAKVPLFTFSHFEPHGDRLMELATQAYQHVALQVPKNFDLNECKRYRSGALIYEDRWRGELLSYTVVF
jgi:trimethylguanosine synthase